ncbi:haloacid dehalogenase type II [Halomarina oriensis]|uniref:Haloacid dehalogenase type II n=1 Tax=Halomarina oriensis TaxID=671145 RepID=A0A6B0GSX1_9EURY|nr:haloacid dehalogenase type II [Halomarina oriensis]MWG35773.1 haloacid dehalogenase type II [Halomarina oriensis]
MFDADRVSAVTFDSYSTLVDVDSVEQALADRVDDPTPVSRLWRARSLEYTLVANHVDAYQPFYEMNRDALTYALDVHDVDVSEAERDDILATYHELDVFEDVRESIERLHDAGYPCHVVSNGNPEMLDSMVEHAGIGDLLDGVVSAHEVETFKPAAELYEYAAEQVGEPTEELTHVSALWLDVQGATHAGLQGVWLNRENGPWEPFDGEPTLEVPSIRAFADRLLGG